MTTIAEIVVRERPPINLRSIGSGRLVANVANLLQVAPLRASYSYISGLMRVARRFLSRLARYSTRVLSQPRAVMAPIYICYVEKPTALFGSRTIAAELMTLKANALMECKFYRESIHRALGQSASYPTIARQIYLSYPTFSFVNHPEKEFVIRNEISKFCAVDLFSIQFGGSAKTGESYHKDNFFEFGRSDLDAAIISSSLFLRYLEITLEVTDNFTDLTAFSVPEDADKIRKYISNGIFVPEIMPNCSQRIEWISFFNNLSDGNLDLFDNINGWIYSTQRVFELKFAKTVVLLDKKTL